MKAIARLREQLLRALLQATGGRRPSRRHRLWLIANAMEVAAR